MSETENLPAEVKEQLEKIGAADVVIGLPAYRTGEDMAWASSLADKGLNLLIAYPSSGEGGDLPASAGPPVIRYPLPAAERYLNAPTNIFGSYHEVFQICQRVGAKSCCVWNSNPNTISEATAEQMLSPVLGHDYDLVVPRYWEMKLSALVNSSILYPMTRALYGKRIHFPMALDLSVSRGFADRLLQADPRTRIPRSQQWITTEAVCSNLAICEVNLLMEPPRIPDSADLSSILAAVLSRLFSDLERNTQFWQRSSGSQTVPAFGEPARIDDDGAPIDVQRMIETFQLGYRNLSQIWSLALTPATLVDLKRLTRLTATDFRMADELWVRIIYDFALAHRQRAINREHLLRAMTPLYLAWVASYASEMRDDRRFQERLERLAVAFEKQKPYLLSRWRWPDRFNP